MKSEIRFQSILRPIVMCSLLIFFGFSGHLSLGEEISDDLVTVNTEATSTASNVPEATREIMQTAMATVAREHVIEIIGEKKYQKNKAIIERKIIGEAAKFIPISNSRNLVQDSEKNYKASVELKISLSSLRKMIQATGLLVDSDDLAVILPLIVFRDDKNSFAWWELSRDEAKKNLNEISQLFDSSFSDDMFKNAFFVIKPNSVVPLLVPEGLRSTNLKKEDAKFLASYFHSNLIVRGEVIFKSQSQNVLELSLKLNLSQSLNDREIAEVTRNILIERANLPIVLKAKLQSVFSEVSKDLSAQILDTWQKGTLGSNSILVSVKGLATPRQVQDFKNELRKNIHDIKALKERIFESGQVTFEMEYNSNEANIVEKFKSARLDSFEYKFVDSSDKIIKTEAKSKIK